MTDSELAAVVELLQLDPSVVYRLRDDGPPLFDQLLPCWFCTGPAHREPPPGSSCPVRIVPAAEVLTAGAPRWLAAERAR